MEKKRSKGIIVFGILIILGSLVQMLAKYNDIKCFLQPLSEKIILTYYFITKILLILGIFSGIGILYLKDIFRKIALFLSLSTLLTYLFEAPFFIFKNLPQCIEQYVIEIGSIIKDIPLVNISQSLWLFTISGMAIDFIFAICVFYYFTRLRVKEQFS